MKYDEIFDVDSNDKKWHCEYVNEWQSKNSKK